MIKLHHPETGQDVEAHTEIQARILERSGWIRGEAPEPTIGSTLDDPPKEGRYEPLDWDGDVPVLKDEFKDQPTGGESD